MDLITNIQRKIIAPAVVKRVMPRAWDDLGKEGTTSKWSALNQLLFKPYDVKKSVNRVLNTLNEINSGKRIADTKDILNLQGYLVHADALAEYLGQPQWTNSLKPALYQPTKGKLNNGHYVTYMRNPYEKDWLMTAFSEGIGKGDYEKLGYVPDMNPYLRNYQIGSGYDPKRGLYLSYYDVEDFNTESANKDDDNTLTKTGDNVGKWIGGKPFDIYDRPIYFDEYFLGDSYKGDPATRGTTYPAGEITVRPSNIPTPQIFRNRFTQLTQVPLWTDLVFTPNDWTEQILQKTAESKNSNWHIDTNMLNDIFDFFHVTPKIKLTDLDLDWITKDMSGDLIISGGRQRGWFKQGGNINYINLFK